MPAMKDCEERMAKLMHDISADFMTSCDYTGVGELSNDVATACRQTPRHLFVLDNDSASAYHNTPQSIGHGQTISQPFIVALMTQLLDVSIDSTVLEIGTGSGYQTAILSRLVNQVYTLEVIAALLDNAQRRFHDLGLKNVQYRLADGYHGWSEVAPFDRVMITAAGATVPQPIVDQLKVGGKIVAPLGRQDERQYLYVMTKEPNGKLLTQKLLPVRFVPFTRSSL